ncbi:uncharacterized protein G2W53_017514 [Senna tora]|uniref:Uncharacterized protein n=1 Tax=Senna tora TaxID=362788 RepID=A0A834TQI6_9FABA|nr:uncharacterized protein G2W53_017514 [Senna tora]
MGLEVERWSWVVGVTVWWGMGEGLGVRFLGEMEERGINGRGRIEKRGRKGEWVGFGGGRGEFTVWRERRRGVRFWDWKGGWGHGGWGLVLRERTEGSRFW